MDFIELNVKERNTSGKSANRQLRLGSTVPAVLYGDNKGTLKIQIENRAIVRLISDGNKNSVLMLKGLEKDTAAIIKEIQKDARVGKLLHLDFLRVAMDTKIETILGIEFIGEPAGVKLGGVLQQILRELHISSLPGNIPEKYELDVSELDIGQGIKIGDLRLLEGVEILGNADDMIVSVVQPTELKEEPVEEEEVEEGEEGVVSEGEDESKEGTSEENEASSPNKEG